MARKLFLICSFLLLSSFIRAQVFERTFDESEIERLLNVDSLAPDIWKYTFSFGWGGSGPNYSQELQALYYRAQDSLWPIKPVLHSSDGFRYQLPLLGLSETESIWLQFIEAYPFVSAKWVDLKDSVYEEFQDYYDFMTASLNWQYQRDSVFALFNSRTFEEWSNLRMGSDSIFLVHIESNTENYKILDTFLLQSPIISPGCFFISEDGRNLEYIYDSLHYHFSRGKKAADSVNIDEGAFYGGPKLGLYREAYFQVNLATYRNYELGQTWLAYDSLGADLLLLERFRDGNTIVKRKLVYPYKLGPNFSSAYDFTPERVLHKFQDANVTTLQYVSAERDSFAFFRMEGDSMVAQQRFIIPSDRDFRLNEVHSFADASFLLMGSVAHGRSLGSDAWSRPHFIFLGPSGSTWWNNPKDPFQVHYNSQASSLTVFYPDGNAPLDYRIIDASGRSLQKGSFKAYEKICLGNWQFGVYRLQLWERDGAYIGQQPFLSTPQ